jgi:translocation and assembly module TamB
LIRWLSISLAAILLAALPTSPVLAQDSTTDEDRGYLQALLEDNLSSDGTEVKIEGFVGSLASTSSFDRMTIADKDGVWLTLEAASLDWRRRALLSGTLDVTDLSVERIKLDRLPTAAAPKAEAEAAPFALPDLPVEVNLGAIRAGVIELGPELLGTAAELSLAGSANLSGGTGALNLSLSRIDGQKGEVTLATSYSNTDKVLALDLLLDEGKGGLTAGLLSLYQDPAVRLSINGTGPMSDFTADIDLTTDAVQRLSGQVKLTSSTVTETAGAQHFAASLSGDIAPLLEPRLAPFFGSDVALDLSGQRLPDSRIKLDTLSVDSAALSLNGQLDLAPDGMPERFNLSAQITPDGQEGVALPLSGPETTVTGATLTAEFDGTKGEVWQLAALVTGFQRDGMTVQTARLDSTGTIRSGELDRVTGKFKLKINGGDHENRSGLARGCAD